MSSLKNTNFAITSVVYYYVYWLLLYYYYITAYDIIGRQENLSRCLVLLPIAVSWIFEFENDATGSKYQKIIDIGITYLLTLNQN